MALGIQPNVYVYMWPKQMQGGSKPNGRLLLSLVTLGGQALELLRLCVCAHAHTRTHTI